MNDFNSFSHDRTETGFYSLCYDSATSRGKTSSYLNSTKVELSYELVLQKVNVCTGVAQHLKTFHVIEIEIKEKLEFNWKFFILN